MIPWVMKEDLTKDANAHKERSGAKRQGCYILGGKIAAV